MNGNVVHQISPADGIWALNPRGAFFASVRTDKICDSMYGSLSIHYICSAAAID